ARRRYRTAVPVTAKARRRAASDRGGLIACACRSWISRSDEPENYGRPSKLLRDPGQHREQRGAVARPEQLVQPRLVLGCDQLLRARQHGAALVGKNQDVRAAI